LTFKKNCLRLRGKSLTASVVGREAPTAKVAGASAFYA